MLMFTTYIVCAYTTAILIARKILRPGAGMAKYLPVLRMRVKIAVIIALFLLPLVPYAVVAGQTYLFYDRSSTGESLFSATRSGMSTISATLPEYFPIYNLKILWIGFGYAKVYAETSDNGKYPTDGFTFMLRFNGTK
jgi:hypothetical protein